MHALRRPYTVHQPDAIKNPICVRFQSVTISEIFVSPNISDELDRIVSAYGHF